MKLGQWHDFVKNGKYKEYQTEYQNNQRLQKDFQIKYIQIYQTNFFLKHPLMGFIDDKSHHLFSDIIRYREQEKIK